ncbi:MAG: hypothetical protein ACRENX_03690 [Candidatus Dormibacteria bacterium]
MGTSTEQARQAVIATRGRVESGADKLEARLRYDLDPRVRLRRDGPKLAAGLAVVIVVSAVYLTRSRRRRRSEDPSEVDWIAQMPREWRGRLQELLAEAAADHPLPQDLRRASKSRRRSVGTGLALRVAKMAAPVIISAAAERIGRRQGGSASSGGPGG